tara:strand:- start:862 stop:1209 length:348 start_codon:yes stop_codon:yes gene_type:complete
MPTTSSLDDNKKLVVTYRVEGGCLGPIGHKHIDKFCEYSQQNIETPFSKFIKLIITPRHDKNLPEMQFNISSKKINHRQAEKYLSLFGGSLDNFECELSDQLTQLIQTYVNEHIK